MQTVHGQEIGVAQVSGRVVVVVEGAAVHGRDNEWGGQWRRPARDSPKCVFETGDHLRRVVLGEKGGSKVFARA